MKVFSLREGRLRSGIEEFHWQAGYGAFSLSSEDVAATCAARGSITPGAAFLSHLEWEDGVTAPP